MFNGYQLKIGSLKLPCPDGLNVNIIENGTYSFTKGRRVINDWQDANGDFHHETYDKKKTTISFTIKERTQEQQAQLTPLFNNTDNITVEYWDDYAQAYKTGTFFIESVEAVASVATREKIYYAPINIILTEY